MRTEPQIEHATNLCKALGARGVIVLAFDRDCVGGASYGQTRRECRDLGRTLDRLVDMVTAGELVVWSSGVAIEESVQHAAACAGQEGP